MSLDTINRDEIKLLLEENLRLAQENQALLKKMHTSMVITTVIHSLKWIAVIVGLVIGYVYAAPYFSLLLKQFGALQAQFNSISSGFKGFR